ncbi:MAG: stress protein [Alicyclobacillus sp. RIFOXYA1_FULL_53_8]|nr:MAG: stress protein [Alicyclobacillus sp. RIFOXYA1_FULL_53_8]
MIEHIVLLKFSEQTTVEQRESVVQGLRGLKQVIPGIIDLQCNHNISTRNQGYQIGLTIRFLDADALATYGPHPEHQKVVTLMHEVGALPALVVDFVVEE